MKITERPCPRILSMEFESPVVGHPDSELCLENLYIPLPKSGKIVGSLREVLFQKY